MKVKRLLMIGAFSALNFLGNTQVLTHVHDWTLSRGDDGFESGESIAVADDGSVYSTGVFEQTVDFGTGITPWTKTSNGARDVYVCKHDENGAIQWARSFGNNSSEEVVAIALDSESNVYITGRFYGTVDFNPSPFGTFTMTQTGGINRDVYVCKFDAGGNFIWARKFDGSNALESTDIETDIYDNVHITGSFSDQVDIDPSLTNTLLLTSAGSGDQDGYCVTLDKHGVYYKSYHLGGSQSDVSIASVAIDPHKEQYFTGEFTGTCDFDQGPSVTTKTSTGLGSDAFVMRVDHNRGFRFVNVFETSVASHPKSIKLDANKNIYTMGTFSGTIDLGRNGITQNTHATSNLRTSVYVSKLSYNGQHCYGKSIAGTGPISTKGNVYGEDLDVTAGGYAYVTGSFTKNVDFKSGSGTSILSAVGTEDGFICGFNNLGNLNTLKTIESQYSWGSAKNNAIALNTIGEIYTTGNFTEMANFNPSGYAHFEISLGGYDLFIHKLEKYQPPFNPFLKSNGESANVAQFDAEVYPNPTANFINVNVSGDKNVHVSIYGINGDLVYSDEITAGLSRISLQDLSAGTYVVKINNGETTKHIKVVKH